MAEKEMKRQRIHRILIILVIILVVALFLELRHEKSEWKAKGIRVEPQEQRHFSMPSTKMGFDFFEPEIDLTETGSEYVIRCDLPGVDKDQIEISVRGSYVTISGRRDIKKEEAKEGVYYYRERKSGFFQRSILLPGLVAEEAVKAEYKDGILVIKLPKKEPTEEPEAKKVQII